MREGEHERSETGHAAFPPHSCLTLAVWCGLEGASLASSAMTDSMDCFFVALSPLKRLSPRNSGYSAHTADALLLMRLIEVRLWTPP